MITIKEEDYEFRTLPRGAGGQHVGVDSSVLVIHKPSGFAYWSRDERSHMRNKSMGVMKLTDMLIRAGVIKCSCSDET
jgi:protein subunit release factor B